MSIAVNSALPVLAVQGATGAVALQPGTVVAARVIKVDGDQVQIAIGNQTIAARSEVALQPGQSLQLSVSQTADGVKLAVVPQQISAQLNLTAAQLAGNAAALDLEALLPDQVLSLASQLPAANVALQSELSPAETVAVATAAQVAAAQQGSLAPLFANLAAADLGALPPKLQVAVLQVLAQRTTLDPGLSGADIQQAFQASGLFMEASLAAGASAATPILDLKAALIVLRQVLANSLGSAAATQVVVPTAASIEGRLQAEVLAAERALTTPAAVAAQTTAATATPLAELQAQQLAAQQATASLDTIIAEFQSTTPVVVPAATAAEAGARTAASNAALSVLQEALQANPLAAGQVVKLLSGNAAMLSLLPLVTGTRLSPTPEEDVAQRGSLTPPPIRGALPTVQPVEPASSVSHEPFDATARRLLSETDAAIARQTLLQVASLPDRADSAAARSDPATARWNFEIPFVTAQGTAVAQFEISRESQAREVDPAKRVWRARFSLDVEPAGPVHALVSLIGDKTSVRMWAERPSTAAQLRAGSGELSRALSRAELQPGEIVIREGAPSPPPAAAAGYFLDRAL